MSNEFKDEMLQLLTQVDDVKATEAALHTERKLHQDQIAKSEADLKRTENDIEQCRENALALRRQMDDLKNEIFARPEDEETIAVDETHVPIEGEHASEGERQRAWKNRQRQLRTV
jgi:predicted  nucleic acid-binding Zn-ribbon protein